jgi:hypothetical protein
MQASTSSPREKIAASVVRHALARLAYFKAPGYVAFVDALPLTASQKVQRGELRELAKRLPGTAECFDMRMLKRRQKRIDAAASGQGALTGQGGLTGHGGLSGAGPLTGAGSLTGAGFFTGPGALGAGAGPAGPADAGLLDGIADLGLPRKPGAPALPVPGTPKRADEDGS